ncbi:MAG: hypothetical protein WBG46_07985 [Nonlabens sp.]
MVISYDLLETVEQCDLALEILNAEKTTVSRRLRNLGESLESKSDRTVETSEGIAASEAIISGFQSALSSITDEKTRRDLELKVEVEETKLKRLENRQASYNSVSVIEDQVDHTQLEVQIPVLDDAIAGVEARKTALEA